MSDKKTFAVISLICAILAVLTGCLWGIGLIFAIAAIVFFFVSKKKDENAKGLRTTALIIAIVGGLIGVCGLIFGGVFLTTLISGVGRYMYL